MQRCLVGVSNAFGRCCGLWLLLLFGKLVGATALQSLEPYVGGDVQRCFMLPRTMNTDHLFEVRPSIAHEPPQHRVSPPA